MNKNDILEKAAKIADAYEKIASDEASRLWRQDGEFEEQRISNVCLKIAEEIRNLKDKNVV